MRKFEDEEEAYFHIDLNELYSLFDPDNIRDHISNSKLKGFNGHIGLQTQLRTDLKKGKIYKNKTTPFNIFKIIISHNYNNNKLKIIIISMIK